MSPLLNLRENYRMRGGVRGANAGRMVVWGSPPTFLIICSGDMTSDCLAVVGGRQPSKAAKLRRAGGRMWPRL